MVSEHVLNENGRENNNWHAFFFETLREVARGKGKKHKINLCHSLTHLLGSPTKCTMDYLHPTMAPAPRKEKLDHKVSGIPEI